MADSKRTIVLAEDDKFISKAYSAGLSDEGFNIIAVYDGEEALKAIKENKPDLILLDLVMPSKNGFEVLEDLNLDKSLKGISVLVLSNLGQESDIEKAKALGAKDYLVKSNFSMKEVIEKVKFYLAKV
jgi:two-component system, OmpR family, alkaline phosphatase synthesis response regulator PhoP